MNHHRQDDPVDQTARARVLRSVPRTLVGVTDSAARRSAKFFRGLQARGMDAFVEHLQISGGLNWVVDWFDAKAGVSYRIKVVSDSALASFDGQGLAANNVAGAHSSQRWPTS